MPDGSLWMIITMVICLIFSAFFSASETAFTSFNKTRMRTKAEEGNKRAERVLKMSESYDKLLSTILVGNNIVNILLSSVATVWFIALLVNTRVSGYASAISTAVITIIVLIFGEITPKSLAKDHPEGFAIAVSGFLKAIVVILTPINFIFMLWKKLVTKIFKPSEEEAVTEGEVLTLIDEAHEDGSIDEYNKELIENIFDFDDLSAGEIATHRTDLTFLDYADTMEEWDAVINNSRYSRYPICKDGIDNVIGILDARLYLRLDDKSRENVMNNIVSDPYFVPEAVKADVLFKNMREHILKQGGEILFSTKLTDFTIKDGVLQEVTIKNVKTREERRIEPQLVVLAIGHSARDTFEKLRERGVSMRQKDFAVGVRIEHLQDNIGLSQYGKNYKLLPPADYKLVSKTGDRSAFTFCMCPGGFVMPASSEKGGVVVNGMSNYARDERNANSALIVQVRASDFSSDNALAGVEYQRTLERKAFIAGGGDYSAPIQRVGDFLDGKTSDKFGEILPSYGAGTRFCDLKAILPNYICDSLKIALVDMDRRLKGFCSPDALLTAVETRTSSPVRIERTESLESINVARLYPCGEGAGYAGGITSSAADGLRVAEAIFAKLNA